VRILAMTTIHPNPYQPGLAAFNRQRFRRLSTRVPLAVVAPVPWTVEFAARLGGRPALPRGRIARVDGLEIHHPRYYYLPRLWRGALGESYERSVAGCFGRIVRSFEPDLIFAPWIYPDGLAAVRLGQAAGLPVVLMAHGSDVLGLDASPGRRAGTIEAIRGADAVVTVSQDLARAVVELGGRPGRVAVNYDGVDLVRFRPGPEAEARTLLGLDPGGPPIVLTVGNLLPVKGLDVLLDAFARLFERRVPFAGQIIGGGPLESWLRRRIARLGLQRRVELLGPMPHDELPARYRAARVLALPSRSEGVPTVLLEATACGIPFVASRVGGVPEVADLGRGLLVPPGDPDALADALAMALKRPPDPPEGGIRPPRGVDEGIDELIGILERVVDGPGRASATLSADMRRGA